MQMGLGMHLEVKLKRGKNMLIFCLSEFWLGLTKVATLTLSGHWELQVELEDYNGVQYIARYNRFRVKFDGPFCIKVSGYDSANSTLQDSLSYHNGRPFSTSDDDNDSSSSNCAAQYGAWWHGACHHSNLNGYNYFDEDLPETSTYYANGIIWRNEENVPGHYHYFSWPKVEMKIRKIE